MIKRQAPASRRTSVCGGETSARGAEGRGAAPPLSLHARASGTCGPGKYVNRRKIPMYMGQGSMRGAMSKHGK